MSPTVCLTANTLGYSAGGGGHRWYHINWARGLRSAGCEVVWLEAIEPGTDDDEHARREAALRADLEPHGLASSIVLYDERRGEMGLEACGSPIDLVLTLSYGAPARLLEVAGRSAMIDTDPGVTQLWIRKREIELPAHDIYFTIGEAARPGGGGLPECGIEWHYTPPCVDVSAWPRAATATNAPYTTISHWWSSEYEGWVELNGEWIENSKRGGFQPFIGLPAHSPAPLELALGGLDSPEEADRLRSLGWRVRDAWTVAASTDGYAAYVRGSRGEFSCTKPAYWVLAPGWVSDRTVCYLASGKPAVVEYAGGLELLDEQRGLLQFRSPDEAARALHTVEENYQAHSEAARALAEARFDARSVATALLERALP